MIATVRSGAVTGVSAEPVDVEVRTGSGKERFVIIGLADGAVRESRDRVLSALASCGFRPPDQILVNLAPAGLKKEGAAFDLAVAVGILVSCGALPAAVLEGRSFFGELSLDGRVKPVRGAVALTIGSLELGHPCVAVPRDNLAEARLIPEVDSAGFASLGGLVRFFRGEGDSDEPVPRPRAAEAVQPDFGDVTGQAAAKRALAVAAAGGHNVLMIGPPGCGKSMLAARFPSLLPPTDPAERLEVVKVHSVAGLPIGPCLAGRRPFRSPHRDVSDAGLVGGGSPPRPGEVTLAHHGVLFLDEFPEFRRSALEALRTPLESGHVQVTRARATVRFPTRFRLVAAMNPCPCGRLGVPGLRCLCGSAAVDAYVRKLSQPVLDRIDVQVELAPVPLAGMSGEAPGGEPAEVTRSRAAAVAAAHAAQHARQGKANALLGPEELRRSARLGPDASALVAKAAERFGLSARGYVRVLRTARTVADLEGERDVAKTHVAEALSYRCLERSYLRR